MVPVGRAAFDFPALTYFSERPSDRIPYITLFPIGTRMRANLFVYRGADDPWLRELRRAPAETLNAALPRLKRITGDFDIAGEIKIRPVDLYVNSTHIASPASCWWAMPSRPPAPPPAPASDKVFTDVERLCNVHIPEWLATDGMDADKIAAFYADPVKRACDEWSAAKAFDFRSVSIATSFYWTAQRWARFIAWSSKACCGRSEEQFIWSRTSSVTPPRRPRPHHPRRGRLHPRRHRHCRHRPEPRAMRLVDLVVPQLAIGAVPGEQLGMRAALDRPAP